MSVKKVVKCERTVCAKGQGESISTMQGKPSSAQTHIFSCDTLQHTACTQVQLGDPGLLPVMHTDLETMVQVVNYVRSYGMPNVYGARVPMKNTLES